MDILLKSLFLLSLLVFFVQVPSLVDARNCNLQSNDTNNLDHLVNNLPGQPSVNFKHYAGHITVNESHGRALFYWFYESSTQPDKKPLVLWLNGGPGCSSVGYGATQEIGPFLLDSDGRSLKLNQFAWNKEANILFLESPFGVGYSYTNTGGDFDKLGDELTTNDSYAFLHKWFLKFPSYRKRTFFIAGESYAGKYVPELAEMIVDKNKNPSLFINLQGILLGNPETHNAEDWKGMVDYAWSHAVVSDETHKTIVDSCDFYRNDTWDNKICKSAVDELFNQYNEIDIYSLYTPVCVNNLTGSPITASLITAAPPSKMMPRVMGGYDPCLDDYAKSYYNRADVQKALHVITDGNSPRNWSICNMTVFRNWSDERGSVIPIYKKLINEKLRIWIYSGDTDGRVPVLSTRYSLSSLGLGIKMPWRPWYHLKQVAGWLHEYHGLTFATFRGAGHAVPIFKPSESLALFKSFLVGEALPSHR